LCFTVSSNTVLTLNSNLIFYLTLFNFLNILSLAVGLTGDGFCEIVVLGGNFLNWDDLLLLDYPALFY